MTLANPQPVLPSPPMLLDHQQLLPVRSLHNLLLMANNGPATANLLLAQLCPSLLAVSSSAGQQLFPPHLPATLLSTLGGQNNPPQQIDVINKNSEVVAIESARSQPPEEEDTKPPLPLITASSLPPRSQHWPHSCQPEPSIWELLLAKSNALSLFSNHGLVSNLVSVLPPTAAVGLPADLYRMPCQQHPAAVPNQQDPSNLMRTSNQSAAETLALLAEQQWKLGGGHLDCNQLESLSRNKLGRSYNPGRPLGMLDRQKILELYQKGLKISHIAKVIGVTHSCVSKIMTRYRRTGSIHPRSAQLSLLGRKQPPTVGQSPASQQSSGTWIVPNPSLSQQQLAGWPIGSEAMALLKCSERSAFHRVNGDRASSEEEERREGTSSGESLTGIAPFEGLTLKMEAAPKPHLMHRLLN